MSSQYQNELLAMRIRIVLGAVSALLLTACPGGGDITPPISDPVLSLNGSWSTLETETNLARTRCPMQYTLVLHEASDSTVTGTMTGNASVPCVREAKTALDSAQKAYDPAWGMSVATIAPVNIWGTRSGPNIHLNLRSPLWELTGTLTITGGSHVSGTAQKRDYEFPSDNAYSGTFSMTKVSK